jgi:hypothetical protein
MFSRPIIDHLVDAHLASAEVDVFYDTSAPKFAGRDVTGPAVSA